MREFNDKLKEYDIPKAEVSRITFESLRTQAKGMAKPSKRERSILRD